MFDVAIGIVRIHLVHLDHCGGKPLKVPDELAGVAGRGARSDSFIN